MLDRDSKVLDALRMDVSQKNPIIYVSVSGLWATTTLVVIGIVPALPGHPSPTREELGNLTADDTQPKTIALPIAGKGFKYAAIEFAVTVAEDNIGTATITIARDDDPLNADGTRPVAKTIQLTRAAGDPLFLDIALVLSSKVTQ